MGRHHHMSSSSLIRYIYNNNNNNHYRHQLGTHGGESDRETRLRTWTWWVVVPGDKYKSVGEYYVVHEGLLADNLHNFGLTSYPGMERYSGNSKDDGVQCGYL